MKPIKLVMTAFGPYAGEEVIDFAKIHENSLFLVTGPTGAGKTTIFDAICYALYGETSGNERSGEALRSDFAPKTLLTSVEFQFSLKGKHYIVERKPKQERAKARGEGTTTEKASAYFKEMNADKGVAKLMDVNVAVKDLIGLTAEQFRQIMMIPQGSFQKFILANSDERGKILKTLFDTSLYGLIQLKLKDQAIALRSMINNEMIRRDEKFRRIKRLTGSDIDIMLKQDVIVVDEMEPLINQLIADDLLTAERLESDITTAKNKKEKKVKEREHALNNNQLIHRLHKEKEELKLLDAKQAEMDGYSSRIEKAHKLLAVMPFEEQLESLKLKNRNTEKEQSKLLEVSRLIKVEIETLDILMSHIESEETKKYLDDLREKIGTLKRYSEKVKNYHSLKLEDRKNMSEIKNLTAKSKSLQDDKENQQEQLKALKLKLETIQGLALEEQKKNNQQLNLDNMLGQLRILYNRLENGTKLEADLQNAKKDLELFKEKEVKSKNIFLKAENSVRQNTAAVLAKDLKAGEACPVCGSEKHIKLAVFPAEVSSDTEIENLRNQYDNSRSRVAKTEYKIQSLENQIKDNLKETDAFITDLKTSGKWEERLENITLDAIKKLGTELGVQNKEIKTDISMIKEQVKSMSAIKKKIDETQKTVEDSENKIKTLETTLRELQNKIASTKALIDETEKDIPEEYLIIKDFNQIIKDSTDELSRETEKQEKTKSRFHQAQIKDKETDASLKHQTKALEQLQEEIKSVESKFTIKKEELGLQNQEEYNILKSYLENIDTFEEKVKLYNQKKMEVKSNIHSLEEQIDKAELTDLTEINQLISELDLDLDNLSKNRNNLLIAVSDNKQVMGEIQEISFGIKDTEKEYSVVGKLSRVANGSNSKKLSFERFVLAAFLEDILKAANIRLLKMTDKRYKLKRFEDVSDKRMAGGLELHVLDHYTGISRHVNTLSGGESFKASLSMALGLSDVVQSYAGGIRLDTMFIDEGFGTLDAESLDQAVECLIEIQKTGRLVGIISHVDDLKERIKVKLEIIPTNSGSRTNNFG